MVKITVLSDTHKNINEITKIAHIMEESDYTVHLGDCSSDMLKFRERLGGKLIAVDGNCDFFSSGETERIFEAGGVRILCCHGHKYGVKSSLDALISRAKEKECTVALYGHTHKALIDTISGVTLINPGCMTACSGEKSYAYVLINSGKTVSKIVKI